MLTGHRKYLPSEKADTYREGETTFWTTDYQKPPLCEWTDIILNLPNQTT